MIGQLYVMAKREARRDLSDKGRMLFDVAWPLMIMAVLGFGVDAFAPPKADLSYFAFLGPGLIGLLAIRQSFSFGLALEKEARYGFREYLVTPIPRAWIVVGVFLGRMFTQASVTLIVSMAYIAIAVTSIDRIGWTLLATLVGIFTSLAIGLAMAVKVFDLRKHAMPSWMIVIAMGLVSGVFFPTKDIPFGLANIAYISPLTYLVDSIRGFAVETSMMPPFVGLGVTIGIGIICMAYSIWNMDVLFKV